MRPAALILTLTLCISSLLARAGTQQQRDGFTASFKHPAIDYEHAPLADPVTQLADAIGRGRRLAFANGTGYLAALLDALAIPVESQVVVFSQTSLQAPIINPKNPRAIYFNDQAAVGYVRGSDVLEIAAQDPRQGVIFYTLDQQPASAPAFRRRTDCLRCHVSWDTYGVPGTFVLSTGPADPSGYATGGVVDDRDRFADRWGGWFVTGRGVPSPNMGVVVSSAPWLAGKFDTHDYLSPHSDVVALMVLEHQTHMANLLTYLGWEARVDATDDRVQRIARDLVDYMLFVDEARLPAAVSGSTAFAERFAAEGRRDRAGRSLHDLDLRHRLMRYPCSYLIESPAFQALPTRAKNAVLARLTEILSGRDADPKYRRLTDEDRRALREILQL